MHFISFEGLDGSGKSTLMRRLKEFLSSNGHKAQLTREPGGTTLGDSIRDLLLKRDLEAPTPRAELLLYEASRAQHVEKVIQPALKEGFWVLCDRYTASSVAFQAGGRNLSLEQVEWLNHFATSGLAPELTVLIDVSWEECQRRQLQRQQSGGGEKDRMESEAESFHQKVRQSFLNQAKTHSEGWLVLDGSKSPEALEEHLLTELRRRNWLAS